MNEEPIVTGTPDKNEPYKVVLACLALGVMTLMLFATTSSKSKPTFKVGDCILRSDAELWDTNDVERIDRVGDFSYKLSFWSAGANRFEPYQNSALKLTFERAQYYRVVACPK